jgi:hypothetical protein
MIECFHEFEELGVCLRAAETGVVNHNNLHIPLTELLREERILWCSFCGGVKIVPKNQLEITEEIPVRYPCISPRCLT